MNVVGFIGGYTMLPMRRAVPTDGKPLVRIVDVRCPEHGSVFPFESHDPVVSYASTAHNMPWHCIQCGAQAILATEPWP